MLREAYTALSLSCLWVVKKVKRVSGGWDPLDVKSWNMCQSDTLSCTWAAFGDKCQSYQILLKAYTLGPVPEWWLESSGLVAIRYVFEIFQLLSQLLQTSTHEIQLCYSVRACYHWRIEPQITVVLVLLLLTFTLSNQRNFGALFGIFIVLGIVYNYCMQCLFSCLNLFLPSCHVMRKNTMYSLQCCHFFPRQWLRQHRRPGKLTLLEWQ